MNKKKFLKKYVNTPSPSGYEILLGGQKVWIKQVKPFCNNVDIDDYGNAYAYYNEYDKNKKTILLDAHCDEIGFFVFDITDSGYIKIGCLGGSDITIAPSSRVNIWTEHGKVSGVFGHPAIHVHKREFKAEKEKMFIDIGATDRNFVEDIGIKIGDPITMIDGYMELVNYHCGRSLDDKIGGYINAVVLQELHESNIELPFNLVVVNSVQEEVGLYGAKMASNKISPDVAIAIDVTHDTNSPAYDRNKQGLMTCGKGVSFMNSPSIQKNLLKLLINTAKNNDIEYQLDASGGSSGTNTDSYAYPKGIPSALISIPIKYMHTTIEMVNKIDVKNAIKFIKILLQSDDMIKSFKYEI
ncbi:M20/M25/M40 family metallo-hydrolase [Candidatus Dojkabacteria bacterium]|jgi:putative aminopeptidase FrvX|nr:M20/M25/M40 family metallo-hydrolase [Candidatus Dojkabacteria bacterium]